MPHKPTKHTSATNTAKSETNGTLLLPQAETNSMPENFSSFEKSALFKALSIIESDEYEPDTFNELLVAETGLDWEHVEGGDIDEILDDVGL